MIQIIRILVATDFGEASDAALLYGRELARTFRAALHVVHVTEDLGARAAATAGYPDYLGSLERLQQDAVAAADKALAERVSAEDRAALHAETAVIQSASPARAIIDYAREHRVDLIVAGTHGRGAVEHLLLGSVAERIVRHAPCAVLTVRARQHDFVRPDALEKRR
jgi:nucleotide-binding universal stress UspA family protein